MKTKISLKRISVAAITGSIVMLVLVPWIVGAQPSATPMGGNVEANFFSVQLPTGPKMTGSFGHVVGTTNSTTTGRILGGYAGMKSLCNTSFTNSHVCSAAELINSGEHGIAISSNEQVWINNGPPGFYMNVNNDCFGWRMQNDDLERESFLGSVKSSAYGSTWDFEVNTAFLGTCEKALKVACCQY